MNRLFQYSTILLLAVVCFFQVGCQKSDIAPAKQKVAFIKYFGHVANQGAADVQRTVDGGYILLGSTNSYDQDGERDIYLVKTDSLGNEEWSRTFGENRTPNGVTFDETGEKLIILPDEAGYVIAANKRYKQNGNTIATKIVIYKVDLTGAIIFGPVTLREGCLTLDCSQEVSDIKIDTIAGREFYAITGTTTEVSTGSGIPGSDIFIMQLTANFSQMWQRSAYGFEGNDYGVDVYVLDDPQLGLVYCMIGADEQVRNSEVVSGTRLFKGQARVAMFRASSGAVVRTRDALAPPTFDDNIGVGGAVIDNINEKIVVFGHVLPDPNTNRINANEGNLVIIETTFSLDVGATRVRYYSSKRGNMTGEGNYTYNNMKSASIALLPNDEGYICSFTNTVIEGLDSDIGLIKIDRDLNVVEGFPYTFGYQNKQLTDGTLEQAARVIPAVEAIEGTTQTRLEGYVFTGTFGLGNTNRMIGLVKVNEAGNFSPQ